MHSSFRKGTNIYIGTMYIVRERLCSGESALELENGSFAISIIMTEGIFMIATLRVYVSRSLPERILWQFPPPLWLHELLH